MAKRRYVVFRQSNGPDVVRERRMAVALIMASDRLEARDRLHKELSHIVLRPHESFIVEDFKEVDTDVVIGLLRIHTLAVDSGLPGYILADGESLEE